MKRLLYLFRDLVLLGVVVAIMAGGIWGVVLPYRNVFADAYPYQLEAFETGLAFYHFNQGETPFYNLSPLNDYLIASESGRVAHVLKENYDAKNYSVRYTLEKPGAIRQTVEQYFDLVSPWYEMESGGLGVAYVSQNTERGWVITKTVSLPFPENIESAGMTVWFNGEDIVFDLVSGEAYTPVEASMSALIARVYGMEVLVNEEVNPWDTKETSGAVGIINPKRPGYLVIKGGLNQAVAVNRGYWLIEVTESVGRVTDVITQSVLIEGRRAGEKINNQISVSRVWGK
jgi:hypothetical protein